MKSVDFIFVNTERNFVQRLVGAIIIDAEHGESFSAHVAVRFPYIDGYGPKIIEALAQGIVFSDPDKYKDDPKIAWLTVECTEEEYDAMQKEAIRMAEKKYAYSYKAILVGGIADNFSRRLAKALAKLLKCDTDTEADCSETGTNIFRKKVPDFCEDYLSAIITPYFFFTKMIMCYVQNRINIIDAYIPGK